jgi:hypothetical protein
LSYIGSSLQGASILSDYFSGDGSTTAFNLTYRHGNEAAMLVFVAGVKQKATTYALGNGQIQFVSAPAVGTSNIEVIYLNGPVIEPSIGDGAITTPKVANNSITNDKVALTYSSDNFTANGTGNTFTVTTGHTANSVMVAYNGVLLLPVADYGVTSTTLTLTFTPTANSNVSVRYLPV